MGGLPTFLHSEKLPCYAWPMERMTGELLCICVKEIGKYMGQASHAGGPYHSSTTVPEETAICAG